MKQLVLILVSVFGFALASQAQTTTTGKTQASPKMEQKKHVCTDACKKAGKCVVVHGEKGHTCTEACKTSAAASSGSSEAKPAEKTQGHSGCNHNSSEGSGQGTTEHKCAGSCCKKK
ncbi:MAG: hypothetical protein H6607_05515 [Flavobacteriales bacterium]|nr:hypothetical protein [Flavobacteriales bacterium]